MVCGLPFCFHSTLMIWGTLHLSDFLLKTEKLVFIFEEFSKDHTQCQVYHALGFYRFLDFLIINSVTVSLWKLILKCLDAYLCMFYFHRHLQLQHWNATRSIYDMRTFLLLWFRVYYVIVIFCLSTYFKT